LYTYRSDIGAEGVRTVRMDDGGKLIASAAISHEGDGQAVIVNRKGAVWIFNHYPLMPVVVAPSTIYRMRQQFAVIRSIRLGEKKIMRKAGQDS
jgi:hypothetical protein